MPWSKPSVQQVWQAVETYLKGAYGVGASPPSAVRDRLASLRATGDADFWDSPVFERDDPKSPTRYALRLGNKFYPHMKMVIERAPDNRGHLFKADTHDKHIRPPPNSREGRAFAELMKMNQTFSETIEAEWSTQGVSTFKQFLRDDLARRAIPPLNDPAPTLTPSPGTPGEGWSEGSRR